MEPFDGRLASRRARTVPLDRVVDLLASAPTHAPERVEQYRAAMARGDRFPPIAVIALGRRFIVADGHKRLTAYAAFGRRDIVVDVWSIARLFADQWRQVRANAAKNRAIAVSLFTDPRESRRMLRATIGHWSRVARSLSARRPRGTVASAPAAGLRPDASRPGRSPGS